MARLINGALTDRIVATAAAAAISAAVNPSVPMEMHPGRIGDVRQAVRKEAQRAIADDPELAHLTGAEPWYQKRSRWSAIVSGVVVVAAPLLLKYGVDVGPEEQEFITMACTAIGGLVAGWLAYRAGTATKPLGA